MTGASLTLDFQQIDELLPHQTTSVSPRLIHANSILELPAQELEQAVAKELAENPALEKIETATCQVCGSELEASLCPRCLERQKGGVDVRQDDWGDYAAGTSSAAQPDEDELDPLLRVAGEQSLADRLLADLGALLPERDAPIAEYLVGSLNEKGYLACSIEEAADELDVEMERVRTVLRVLQTLEPAGIGARSLRECLLLQLDALEAEGLTQPHAREIITDYLLDLGLRKFALISRQMGISTDEVAAVWEFMRTRLNPHPAQGYADTHARERDMRRVYVTPDAVIKRSEDGFEVEIVESRRFRLRINPLYVQLHGELRRASNTLSAEEVGHIREYVTRAKFFLYNLEQRYQTLHRVTSRLVESQADFLERGVRHLRPLSRSQLAEELGVHESTVSRATAGKHVLLPSGEVIPYSHFFTPSLSIKDVMKEIVEGEKAPLTDSQIATRLRERGITIARRTVAKYRKQLAILPSGMR